MPADLALRYLSDPVNRPEWQSSLRRVEVLDVGPPHRGQRWSDHTAVGLVAARVGLNTDDASGLLNHAAERAGVTESQAATVARVLLA